MPTFKLSEAMSAVEIMDPKMDIGVHRYQRTVSVDTLIEEVLYSFYFFILLLFYRVILKMRRIEKS